MKKFHNIMKLAAIAAGLTLAGCTEELADYTPGEMVDGAQVFFPNSNPASISLSSLSGEFEVPVARADSSEAVTVRLEVKTTSDKFTVPETVQFKAGAKTANLTVSYDGLVYENTDTLWIKLTDNTTPYGVSEYTLVVDCPAPWTPWVGSKAAWVAAGYDAAEWPLSESASTCTYTYTQIFSGDDPGLSIYYRKSLIDPDLAQIRIDNWGYGVSLILDYNPNTHAISIEPQFTGYTDGGVGDFYITDVTHWQGAEIAGYNSWYDPEKGQINLCTAWMANTNHASCYGYGYETVQLDGFYIPDYSVAAVMEGTLTDKNQDTYALLNVTGIGADVEAAKALVVSKSDDAAAVADAILAGDVEAVDLVLGNNKLSLNDLTGELQVVVVSIAEEALQSVRALGFEYYGGGNQNPWQSLGTGLWTDAFVAGLFGLEVPTYAVEIMESTENPGLYRVMNPYSNSVYPYAEDDCAEDGMYVEVNATDPEGVYIAPQSIGFDWGEGAMGICSIGGYKLQTGGDFAALKENGELGVKKDGVITLPNYTRETSDGGVAYFQGYLIAGDGAYYAGGENLFRLVLPEAMDQVNAKMPAFVRQSARARRLAATKVADFGRAPKMVKKSFRLQTSIVK